MKKLFLSLIAMIAMTVAVNAQVEQGSFTVGGNVGFNTFSSDADNSDDATSSFFIVPDVSYFVSDNIALGLGVGYENYSVKVDDDNKANAGIFRIEPYGRYYKSFGGSDKFYFFGELRVNLGFGSSKVTALGTENDGPSFTTIGAALSPNFAFFPSEKFAIEFGFQGITFETSSAKDGNDEDLKGINGGLIDTDGDGTGDTPAIRTGTSFGLGMDMFQPRIGARFFF